MRRRESITQHDHHGYPQHMYGEAILYGLAALAALIIFVVGVRHNRAWLAGLGVVAALTCAALAAISVAGIWFHAFAESVM